MKILSLILVAVAYLPMANAGNKISTELVTVKACQEYMGMTSDFPKPSIYDVFDAQITDSGKSLNVILFVNAVTYDEQGNAVHQKCQVQHTFGYDGNLTQCDACTNVPACACWDTYCGYDQ